MDDSGGIHLELRFLAVAELADTDTGLEYDLNLSFADARYYPADELPTTMTTTGSGIAVSDGVADNFRTRLLVRTTVSASRVEIVGIEGKSMECVPSGSSANSVAMFPNPDPERR